MVPGHEAAAELLVMKALDVLKRKGVNRINGRVTTMCPSDIELAETCGFTLSDWGYKMYYSYETCWGHLNFPGDLAEDINPMTDIAPISELAAHWFKQTPEWCRNLLTTWHEEGILAHVGVRRKDKWISAGLAAVNEIRPSTAALYYIYSPAEDSLTPILVKVIQTCIDNGLINLIVDLVNEHLEYEPVYRKSGFIKVADWARCELSLL
jgi:hypothetical protein